MGGDLELRYTDSVQTETVKYYSGAGGEKIAMRSCPYGGSCGAPTYFLSDHLGSITGTTDSNGILLNQQRYKPFGEVRTDLPAPAYRITMTDMGYTGQKSLMGLLDYHARFYDPGLARFISADSIVPNPGSSMSWDRFAYVNGNPLSFIDPTGHFITKEPDCTQLSCSGDPAHEPKEDDKGESDDTVGKETNLFSVCIQDLGSCYMGGWYNFGGAWSIYSNPNSSASLRILAGLYMGIWGDAHILAAVGISLATYGTYVAILGETSACAASFPCQQQVANTIDDLIAQARSQYPKLAGIYQYHHIFPKYLGGSSNEGIVMVDAAYHQVITNAFRSLWTYGGGKPALDVAQQIIIEVYSLYPLPPVP